jgi:hypothetical protein
MSYNFNPLTVQIGAVVIIDDKELTVNSVSLDEFENNIFLTTTDSDIEAGNEGNYEEHIHHFRISGYRAIMTRQEILEALESGNYIIR